MKLRIILDTNVLISAIFFETGNEANILDEAVKGRVTLLSSLDALQELRETLAAPKFKLTPLEISNIFQLIVSISEIVLAPPSAEVKCRDPDDQKFLDCAKRGDADFLVTGDRDLLEIKNLGRTKIITARELIRLFKRSIFGLAGTSKLAREKTFRLLDKMREEE